MYLVRAENDISMQILYCNSSTVSLRQCWKQQNDKKNVLKNTQLFRFYSVLFSSSASVCALVLRSAKMETETHY